MVMAQEVEQCRTADEIESVIERHIAQKWSHLIQPDRRNRPRV
jgi:hypothetical protein